MAICQQMFSATGEGRASEVLHNLDRWWRRTDVENMSSARLSLARFTSGEPRTCYGQRLRAVSHKARSVWRSC